MRPRARAGSNPGTRERVVSSKASMDMVRIPVMKFRLERFPRIKVGTPSRYDCRYHFGQFLY